MRQFARILTAVVSVSVIAACASTAITSVWRDPAYQGPPKKVLVVGILKNLTNRRVLEDEFVSQLTKRGVAAEAGYAAMPGDKLPDKDVVAATVSAKGFDSLLLVKLMGEKTERNYVAGSMAYSTGPHYGGWSGYYGSGYTAAYSPGYVVEDKFALAEASLYNAATEKIIWTAASETWIKSQDSSLLRGYVSEIMRSLRREKLVP
jgi:hypothetical protein